jgi:hypothetical protein
MRADEALARVAGAKVVAADRHIVVAGEDGAGAGADLAVRAGLELRGQRRSSSVSELRITRIRA